MIKESKLTSLTRERSAADIQKLSRQSFSWLRRKVTGLRDPAKMAKGIRNETDRNTRRFLIGGMYYFYYDPKGKGDMPYYDIFPMVIPLNRYNDGFLGLNLHYLPIKYRVAFMNKLLPLALLDDKDEIKRLRVTYDILKASRKYREFKPCIKRYLYSHMHSKILAIHPDEWDVALYLPVQQFKKEKDTTVWQESVEQIKKS